MFSVVFGIVLTKAIFFLYHFGVKGVRVCGKLAKFFQYFVMFF